MSKTKFKVGDKVRIKTWDAMEKEYGLDAKGAIGIWPYFTKNMRHLCGRTATITDIDGKEIKLDFYDRSGETFWKYTVDFIEPLKNETIVIFRKDSKVFALDKRTGNIAEARCNPLDAFDFEVGARLAFNRLILEPTAAEPQYLTGKVVCVNSNNDFVTTGKIYEFENGYSLDDDGDRMPAVTRCESVRHLNDVLDSDFIKVVE